MFSLVIAWNNHCFPLKYTLFGLVTDFSAKFPLFNFKMFSHFPWKRTLESFSNSPTSLIYLILISKTKQKKNFEPNPRVSPFIISCTNWDWFYMAWPWVCLAENIFSWPLDSSYIDGKPNVYLHSVIHREIF